MRIAVTGLGAVSALGVGTQVLEQGLRTGQSGIGPLTLFDTTDHKTHLAGQVPGLDPASHLSARERRRCSRSDLLGMLAAREALTDAGLVGVRAAGLWVGATTGGMLESELLGRMRSDPSVRLPFGAMVSHPLSSTADRIARLLHLDGPRVTVCSACSSGANAIGLAARALRQGRVSVALAGGADALCRLTYSGFNALSAVDAAPCRPFDRARNGLNLGEAGAMLVLEPFERARARGAVIHAELCGHGSCSEAHHITNPMSTGEGAARAIRLALEDAGLAPEQIDYVNAHGTGTKLNDAMETRALHEVLGARVSVVPVSSSKGQLGHTLGAAGAIEAVVTVLALRGGFAPPTAGLSDPDPDCALDHVMGTARPHPIRFALSSSFGFGGNDAALVLGRAGDAPPRERPARRTVVVTGIAALTPERPGVLEFDARAHLDAGRSRRLDRMSRLGCALVQQALGQAQLEPTRSPGPVALMFGSGFGAFEESTAFMERVLTSGPRLAPPADFPNLLLSSQAAHASIYHRLTGMHLCLTALGASGDLAVATAFDEVAQGFAVACVAGAMELSAPLISAGLGMRTTAAASGKAPHSEGAAVILLEEAGAARARGAVIRATLLGYGMAGAPLDGAGDAARLVAGAIGEALETSGVEPEAIRFAIASHGREVAHAALQRALGREVPLDVLSDELGFHEALGTLAVRAAVDRVASRGETVVSLGLAPGLATCLVLAPPS